MSKEIRRPFTWALQLRVGHVLSLLGFWRMEEALCTRLGLSNIQELLIQQESVVPHKCWQVGDSEMCHAGCFELFDRSLLKRDCAMQCLRFSWKWVPSLSTSTRGDKAFPLPPAGSAVHSLVIPSSSMLAEVVWSPHLPPLCSSTCAKMGMSSGESKRNYPER